MKAPRDYQVAAVDAALGALRAEPAKSTCIVMDTGSGKSLTMALLFKNILDRFPDRRLLATAHTREIVSQDAAALRDMGVDCGIVCAGLKQYDAGKQVVVGSIQTIANRTHEVGYRHMMLVDEAHAIPSRSDSTYQKVLASIRSVNPDAALVGMTATPFRLDNGCLVSGRKKIFDSICYRTDMLELIDRGYLCPIVARSVDSQIDVNGIGTRAGEFKLDELEDRCLDAKLVKEAVREIVTHGGDRKKWLVFGAGVKHGAAVAAAIRIHGVEVREVYGDTPPDERDDIIAQFRDGDLRCVVNNLVLTVGFDAPNIDLIACLRPTKSTGLYCQLYGRGLRVSPSKTSVLGLDFGGNVERHGPLNMTNPSSGGGDGDGVAPVKTCPECQAMVFAGLRTCPTCGFEFPPPEVKHERVASTDELIAGSSEEFDVTRVDYSVHLKGDRAMVRVEYYCRSAFKPEVSEFVFPEHGGAATERFISWWMTRTHDPVNPAPETAAEAVSRAKAGELREPVAVALVKEGKYKRISRHIWRRAEPVIQNAIGCYACAKFHDEHCEEWQQSPPEEFCVVGCDRFLKFEGPRDGVPF